MTVSKCSGETFKLGFVTCHRNSTMVNDYITKCAKFAPFKAIALKGSESKSLYLENFPQSISVQFGDMKKISSVALQSQNKDSLVTLRTYECVVISAIIATPAQKIAAMYHYFKDRDTTYVGVSQFVNKIKKLNVDPSQVHIELASSFISEAMIAIAACIVELGLSIQSIHAKRLIVLKPGVEFISDSAQELTASNFTHSIGVLINPNTGIEVFPD